MHHSSKSLTLLVGNKTQQKRSGQNTAQENNGNQHIGHQEPLNKNTKTCRWKVSIVETPTVDKEYCIICLVCFICLFVTPYGDNSPLVLCLSFKFFPSAK